MDDNVKLFPVPKKKRGVNEDSIKLLEEWISMARNGKIISVCLMGRSSQDELVTSFPGPERDDRMEDVALLLKLAMRLDMLEDAE